MKRISEKETAGIRYKTIHSSRRTLGISVHPERGVTARVPYGTPERVIEKMISDKAEWIRKALKKHESLKRINNSRITGNGSVILLLGKEHRLRIVRSERNYINKTDGDIIELGCKDELPDAVVIQSLIESWLMFVARKVFPAVFREILLRYRNYDFNPSSFSVRKMKSRWGSCTSKGRIAISYDLIKLDRTYAEYVMVHELCHLKHHNHGADFYSLLSEIYPDWKKVRTELRKFLK